MKLELGGEQRAQEARVQIGGIRIAILKFIF